MINIIKLLFGYGSILLPLIYNALEAYQYQHPNPYVAALLAAIAGIGGISLHAANKLGHGLS